MQFTSFDGLSILALVYRPAGVSDAARTPVVIDIHGGPEAQSRPLWNPGAQLYADALGATVILPNVRGSAGYGRRFLDLDSAEKREDGVRDIGALLDWIAAQPGLDASRVVVSGGSYGGYMSLATMTHYAGRLAGLVPREQRELSPRPPPCRVRRRDPAMRAVFARISPVANVARITRPMLVMQGANDPRVPKSESDPVVAGIRKNGASVGYVVFADEGHGFQKKPNNDLRRRREIELVFLARLFGVEI